MESSLHRNRSKLILAALVGGQLILLGYQVRRPQAGGVRVAQLWATEALLPVERASQHMAGDWSNWRHNYIALRDVGRQNAALRAQLAGLELQNQQLRESVRELPQLDTLLGFQHSYGLRTQPAEVLSSGASSDAQTLFLDRGANAGLARNQAVITPQGAVGKITQVLSRSAQVLLITDPDSGVGALIGATGIHGILHGVGAGRAELRNILKDEPVKVGDAVVTSGEDQVYPKGVPLGTITAVGGSSDGVFKTATVRLAADMGRIATVLVVTGALPAPAELPDQGLTAADVRQQLLPGLPQPAAGILPGSTADPQAIPPPDLPGALVTAPAAPKAAPIPTGPAKPASAKAGAGH